MGKALSGRYLLLSCAHIFRQFAALDEGFVGFNREQDRCTATVLGENQRSLGSLYLPDERGNVRAKFRKRPNILTGSSLPHSPPSLNLYRRMYNWRGACLVIESPYAIHG